MFIMCLFHYNYDCDKTNCPPLLVIVPCLLMHNSWCTIVIEELDYSCN